jgi:tRNA (guanine6-N2)-methyltransferase
MGRCRIERVRHREVIFAATRPASDLLDLRTIDDLFVVAAVVTGIGRRRDSLGRLGAAITRSAVSDATNIASSITGSTPSTQIDVSASFVGKRNFSRFEVEDAVGSVLVQKVGATYHSRASGGRPPIGTASWRVTIEDDTAIIGLRLASRPLHRRDWKQVSIPGTLHPPVAAAMVALADLRSGDRVLDPCCGAGTLLIEAAHTVPGLTLIGSDTSRPALEAAKANARGQARIRWSVADAGAIPMPAGAVDRLLVNPPWQRQVDAQSMLSGSLRNLWSQASRVLRPRGVVVALLHDADVAMRQMAVDRWTITDRIPISLFGLHPEILVVRSNQ